MTLRRSYSLLAPLYDPVVARATRRARIDSLKRLPNIAGTDILIAGVGTGLDIPHLPPGARYTAVDLTPAMLDRARRRAQSHSLNIEFHEGDVMALDFPDTCFDGVIMHLILAVVPEPQRALTEAARVLKPGGWLLILDKFLRPNERAPLRRLLNPLTCRIATRIDVRFEPLLAQTPELELRENSPAMARGWVRHILLRKRH